MAREVAIAGDRSTARFRLHTDQVGELNELDDRRRWAEIPHERGHRRQRAQTKTKRQGISPMIV